MTITIPTDVRPNFVRTAGQLTVAGALLGVVGGLITGFIPPVVEPSQFSYPYSPAGFLMAQLVFIVNHLVLLVGTLGLGRSGATGNRTYGRLGVWVSVAGWGLLTLCEVRAMTLAESAYPTAQTDVLDIGFGVATVLIGIGLVLVGIAAASAKVWAGWARFTPLVCGLAVFVMVIPGVFGPFLAGRLVLTAWMLMLAGVGVAVVRSRPRAAVGS
jgi:hypothetical protein